MERLGQQIVAQDECLHAQAPGILVSIIPPLPCEEGVIDTVLQRSKLKFREIRYSDKATERQNSTPGVSASQTYVPNHFSSFLFRTTVGEPARSVGRSFPGQARDLMDWCSGTVPATLSQCVSTPAAAKTLYHASDFLTWSVGQSVLSPWLQGHGVSCK